MALTAATIVTDGCVTLLDPSCAAWPLAERLGYLNEAIRATILVKPDVYPVRGAVTPAAGLVQTLPSPQLFLSRPLRILLAFLFSWGSRQSFCFNAQIVCAPNTPRPLLKAKSTHLVPVHP